MSKSSLTSDQLADYFVGALSSDERAAIDRVIVENPELGIELAGLRRKWNHHRAISPRRSFDAERGWQAVAQQIGVNDRNAQTSHPKQWVGNRALRGISIPQRLQQIVGIGLLSAVLITLGWTNGRSRIRSELASQISTYTTANGQRSTVSLPDGSVVVLNVGSRLEIPADYGMGNRTVRLLGEALFTVAAQTHAPFTVAAGGRTVRVLGTSFTVKHYPTDTITTVAVQDGKVSVDSTVLSAMQQAQFGPSITRPQVSIAGSGQFSFATGVLSLDSLPIVEAITLLNRWYDANIRLGDSTLKYERISGRFAAGSFVDLAENLEWTFNLHVVRSGRVLTLYPRGKNDGSPAE